MNKMFSLNSISNSSLTLFNKNCYSFLTNKTNKLLKTTINNKTILNKTINPLNFNIKYNCFNIKNTQGQRYIYIKRGIFNIIKILYKKS